MILAPVQDGPLQAVVRRAALPEEDVFHRPEDILDALRFGRPRILVCRAEDRSRVEGRFFSGVREIPVLELQEPVLRSWWWAWQADGMALTRLEDSALRLRGLIRQTAGGTDWVETLFSDLAKAVGGHLPPELRGFARRVLEFPIRYSRLPSAANLSNLTAGALKARFRRRGLPSPSRYLRWFRLLAAAHLLADPGETTLSVSFRLGFASDGNFCRWVTALSGLSPTDLREWKGRLLLLLRLVEDCFPPGSLESWEALDGLFLREVA